MNEENNEFSITDTLSLAWSCFLDFSTAGQLY